VLIVVVRRCIRSRRFLPLASSNTESQISNSPDDTSIKTPSLLDQEFAIKAIAGKERIQGCHKANDRNALMSVSILLLPELIAAFMLLGWRYHNP